MNIKICKELIYSIAINKWPKLKQAKDLNCNFSKEDILTANRYMKRCLPSLIFKETQIKITVRYNITFVRMTVIKKLKDKNCWQEIRNKATLWFRNSTSGYTSKKHKIIILKRYLYSHIYCNITQSVQYMQTRYVSIEEWMAKENMIWYMHTHIIKLEMLYKQILFSQIKKEGNLSLVTI